jgi:hypothetical protein
MEAIDIDINEYKLLSERYFYYIEYTGKEKVRNDFISDILEDKAVKPKYLSKYRPLKNEEDFHLANIKKTYGSITRIKYDLLPDRGIEYSIRTIKNTDFISKMKNFLDLNLDNFVYKRNIKNYYKEVNIIKKQKEIRNKYGYKCIEAYTAVKYPHGWEKCPNCGLTPLVWEFDNGRSTGCGCGENEYRHFTINAESIMSCHKHDGNTKNYNKDGNDLQKNWNHWVRTGEILFNRGKNNDRW